MRFLVFAFIASVAACFGAGCAGDAVSSPAVKKQPRLATITLGEMQFKTPTLGRRIRAFDAAADRFAKPTWHRRHYKALPPGGERGAYLAEWATFDNGETNRNPVNYHGPKEMHCISMSVPYDSGGGKQPFNHVIGVHLNARWKPQGAGWGAFLRYTTFEGQKLPKKTPMEAFSITLQQYREPRTDEPLIRIEIPKSGHGWYYDSVHHKDEGDTYATVYDFSVETHDSATEQADKAKIPDSDVLRILASPEAMRDFAIDIQRRLLKQIEQDFASGKALKRADLARMLNHREEPSAIVSKRKLSPEERKQALEAARATVQARIDALERDYEEMYAAVKQAFPIQDCLRGDE